MNSTFTGINISSRGLYVSQAGMSVTTNNISNANTDGYSRQSVNQTAVGAAAIYSGSSILGNGSQITSVDQTRDARLDQRYWQENTRLGDWETKSSALTEMESVLDISTSDSGFSTTFDDFYSALEDLAKDPSDSSTRTTVKETGQAICQYLNETSQRLTSLREDENNSISTTVDEINSYTQQIADLSDRISQAATTGANANDLKDQRGVLIDKLSKLTDISVTECVTNKQADGIENKTLKISINGSTLVDGDQAKELQVVQDSANDGMYRVQWKDTGEAFAATGGQLKAEFDLRDGDGSGSSYKGIPYYMNQLDKFAQTFAEAFNEGVLAGETASTALYSGHAGGETANSTTGIRFFSYDNTSSSDLKDQITASGLDAVYKKITAANITLSKDIEDDVSNIATASSAGGADNSENIDQLIKLVKDSNMFNKGTPEDFYNSIISTIGTDSSTAERRSENGSSLVKVINDRRTSVSGVDTNEETANMTKYQQAYEASAKMVSIWSEVFEKTIEMVND